MLAPSAYAQTDTHVIDTSLSHDIYVKQHYPELVLAMNNLDAITRHSVRYLSSFSKNQLESTFWRWRDQHYQPALDRFSHCIAVKAALKNAAFCNDQPLVTLIYDFQNKLVDQYADEIYEEHQ